MRDIDDLQAMAVYARDRVNPYLFNYALSVALLHRPDTQDLDLPSFLQSFPDKFIDSKAFTPIREAASILPDGARVRTACLRFSSFVLLCYPFRIPDAN